MTAPNYTHDEFVAVLRKHYDDDTPGIIEKVNRWLARGDGAAVYENHDLGSVDVGQIQVVSYGSPDAQLEVAEAPEQLPDIGHRINWRYRLVGTYRGEAVTS